MSEERMVILTAAEVCKLLKITRSTLTQMINNGLVTFYTPGGHVRISLENLNTYLERTRKG